jgi:hypothetical protein
MLMTKIWESGKEWDEEIPPDLKEECRRLIDSWEDVTYIIPRHGGWRNDCQLQIHAFADASIRGLGLAVYSRVVHPQSSSIQTQLLFSKSLTLPTKLSSSIPRAELQSVHNAAKVMDFLKSELKMPFTYQIWSDSTCVIDWLRSKKLIGRYEDNRLKVIAPHPVSHVATGENPADIASRGADARDLKTDSLWWDGPKWLQKNDDEWPVSKRIYIPSSPPTEDDSSFDDDTLKTNAVISSDPPIVQITNFSKFPKLYKSMAYVLRATFRLKELMSTNSLNDTNGNGLTLDGFKKLVGFKRRVLTSREKSTAQCLLFRQAQEENPPSEDVTRDLGIFQDARRILRCHGRFGRSDLDAATILPIYLPPKLPPPWRNRGFQVILRAGPTPATHAANNGRNQRV